jgi:SAM-dependent methyltransferase
VTNWWPDERGLAGAEHLDPAYVAAYEAKAGFDPGADVDILRSFGLGSTSSVVDLGTGTGAFALAVAPLCQRVVAVDISPAMTDALEERVVARRARNIEIVRAGFLTYEHTGDPADFVYTRNALHQLSDFWKAIAVQRVASTLRSGGILRLRDLVFDAEPAEIDSVVEPWLARAVDDPAAGYTAEELATHLRTEFSTYTWLLEPMLERAGFEVLDRESSLGVYGAYTCRKRP